MQLEVWFGGLSTCDPLASAEVLRDRGADLYVLIPGGDVGTAVHKGSMFFATMAGFLNQGLAYCGRPGTRRGPNARMLFGYRVFRWWKQSVVSIRNRASRCLRRGLVVRA